MVRRTPLQEYREACQIAKDHGLLVIQKGDIYQVYRRNPKRNIWLGQRSSPSGLRSFVCTLTKFK
ncbi:MAG: hypothetical protein H6R10_725 [Rhodocyclaceae bacterium]|nr:hypothetical protein [Rhodocyclaceae bacterium]